MHIKSIISIALFSSLAQAQVLSFFTSIGGDVTSIAGGVFDTATSGAAGVFNTVTSGANGAFETATSAAAGAVTTAVSGGAGVVETASSGVVGSVSPTGGNTFNSEGVINVGGTSGAERGGGGNRVGVIGVVVGGVILGMLCV